MRADVCAASFVCPCLSPFVRIRLGNSLELALRSHVPHRGPVLGAMLACSLVLGDPRGGGARP